MGGDGDLIACTDVFVYGLNVRVHGGNRPDDNGFGAPPPPEEDPLPEVPEPVPPPMGGASGEPPLGCLATVVAENPVDDYRETLECSAHWENPQDCQCMGAGERAGVYRVTATLGELSETHTVEVTADQCHVRPVDVNFFAPAVMR